MSKLIYFGKVDEAGVLKLTNKNGFASDLKDFIGREVRLTVELKAKRSNAQNSYFHGVIIPIVRAHMLDTGWKEAKSLVWVKNYIKLKCLIKETVNEDTGEVIQTLGETSGLSKSEFSDMVADIQQFFAEKWDLVIPDPNTQTQIEY